MQRAVEWIEFTIENADLKHLQSPFATVPFLLAYSLDLILIVAVTIIGFMTILFKHLVLEKMLTSARESQVNDISSSGKETAAAAVPALEGANDLPVIMEEDDQCLEDATEQPEKSGTEDKKND